MFKIFVCIAFFINIFSEENMNCFVLIMKHFRRISSGVYEVINGREGVLSGVCPDVIPLKNFDRDEVNGRWYVIRRYPFPLQNNQKCIYADLKTSTTGSLDLNVTGYLTKTPDIPDDFEDVWFQAFKSEVLPIDPNNLSTVKWQVDGGRLLTIDKETLNLNDKDSAKLQSLMSDLMLNYIFIETGYENYLIVYSCKEEGADFLAPITEFAWIVSRNKDFDQEIVQMLENKLSEFGSSTEKFIEDPQDCEDLDQVI